MAHRTPRKDIDEGGKNRDHLGDAWLTEWENETIEEWEHQQSNMDDRLQNDRERSAEKLYQSFQNSATSVATLYKDQSHGVSLWIPFQNSASRVTHLYKDGMDSMSRGSELGVICGRQRCKRDILAWVKKKRRHIRREDLIAYLCGKDPPVRPRPTAALGRMPNMERLSPRSSPRLPQPEPENVEQHEPDLRPFRDALALQRLNGAMSNINVGFGGGSPPSNDSQGACSKRKEDDEFHSYILSEISRRCDQTGRKRSNSGEISRMDSPNRKRSRLL